MSAQDEADVRKRLQSHHDPASNKQWNTGLYMQVSKKKFWFWLLTSSPEILIINGILGGIYLNAEGKNKRDQSYNLVQH